MRIVESPSIDALLGGQRVSGVKVSRGLDAKGWLAGDCEKG